MLFIISALAFFISFGKYIFKHKEDIGEQFGKVKDRGNDSS